MTTQEFANIFQPIATLVLGIVGLKISNTMQRRQADIAKSAVEVSEKQRVLTNAKLRMDLFPYRLEVFDNVRNVLFAARGNKEIGIKHRRNLNRAIAKSGFLFDSSVTEFLRSEVRPFIKRRGEQNQAEGQQNADEPRDVSEDDEKDLYVEASDLLKRFAGLVQPYLTVDLEPYGKLTTGATGKDN